MTSSSIIHDGFEGSEDAGPSAGMVAESSKLTRRSALKVSTSSSSTYGTFSGSHSRELSAASTSKSTLVDSPRQWSSSSPLLKKDVDTGSQSRRISLLQRLNPALRLENAGCVARDHLASERTFLAYVRTSLAISMAGVVLGQMFLLSSEYSEEPPGGRTLHRKIARPLAVFTILVGILVVLTGAFRYFFTQSTLVEGNFTPARTSIGVISSLLVAFTIFVFLALVSETH